MKKIILLTIALVLLGVLVTRLDYPKREQIVQSSNIFLSSPKPSLTATPSVSTNSEPITLSIPKLSINSSIEYVGNDQQGRMDVPKKYMNVGWYKLGFKPGEKGSAVIAGHLDTVNGSPAVFYNLTNLKEGDDIYITTKDNKKLNFKVIKTAVFDYDKVPLQEVFASTDTERLNLITCNGNFNQNSQNYSKRLVVYSKLVPS